MVKTGVQHVRGGRREPKCGISDFCTWVFGALEARGREAGGFKPSWVVAEIGRREFEVSERQELIKDFFSGCPHEIRSET